MQSVEALVELFRQNGFKITPQRRVIFDLLSEDGSHPTAEEVYRRASSAMPDISRTTVYNTLREMVSLGALAEVQDLSAGGVRYDTHCGDHHHLFCTRCHALIDVVCDLDISLEPVQAAGYRITRHQVTFYGLCPNCQGSTQQA